MGLALIVAIVWWFWLYQPKERNYVLNQPNKIELAGGVYTPSVINVPAHRETSLSFLRTDPSPCAEYLIFPDLEINELLPVNQVKEIKLPALSPGRYPFHCQMQMYRGQLHVEGEE
jgi:plastocyanin domain-containing protein